VRFIIDDATEEDWMITPNTYDYIHTRMLLGSFTSFPTILHTTFRYLRPGAWTGSEELYPTVYCDDGTMPADYLFAEWTRQQDAAAMAMGKPMRIANKLKGWYEQAGFVDVQEEVFKLPLNPWPRDPQFKMLGRFHERNYLEGLQGLSLAPFYRGLGWSKSEIEVYLVNVRKSLSDRSVHAYHRV